MVRRKSDSPQKAALREIMSNSLKENDVLSKKYQNTVTQAIEAVYPHAGIQQCIIHQTRNSTKYVSYKDLNKLMANLKKVYAAPGEQAALSNLEDFGEKWDAKYPKVSKFRKEHWPNLATYFKYPEAVRHRRRKGTGW